MVDDNFLLFLFIFVMNTLKQFIMKKPNYFIMGKLLSFLLVLLTVSCNQDLATEEVVNTQKPLLEQSVSQKIDAYAPLLNKQDASKVALLFQKDAKGMTRAAKRTISKVIPFYDNAGKALFYAVDFSNNMGYVLISANKKNAPILAYSDNGSFENAKEKMQVWLEDLQKSLEYTLLDTAKKYDIGWLKYSVMKQIQTTRSTDNKEMWKAEIMKEYAGKSSQVRLSDYKDYSFVFTSYDCLKQYVPYFDGRAYEEMLRICKKMGYSENDILCQVFTCSSETTFGPLLKTYWGQGYPYNGAVKGVLGCTTVAVGQFMNYYRLPVSENWDQIKIDGSREQQLFLKGVGESIGIDYSKKDRGGTLKGVMNSLKNIYGYSNIGESKNFSDTKMREERKPIICCGSTNIKGEPGHMWVIDGLSSDKIDVFVDIYAPLKQDYVSYEVQPDENPYYPYGNPYIAGTQMHEFWHMNWGGAESWNTFEDYYWSEATKSFGKSTCFIFVQQYR